MTPATIRGCNPCSLEPMRVEVFKLSEHGNRLLLATLIGAFATVCLSAQKKADQPVQGLRGKIAEAPAETVRRASPTCNS